MPTSLPVHTPRRLKRYPSVSVYGVSSWDYGDEPEGYHRDWDGVLHSSADWHRYYQHAARWAIPVTKWDAARQVRKRYRQGIITLDQAVREMTAADLPLSRAAVHRLCTGVTYWWL